MDASRYHVASTSARKRDEHIVIVGIDEKDIAWVKQYPIPDEKIAELLTKLETYKPLAIGLDIFKNVPVEPGGEQLAQVLRSNSNIIGIEKFYHPEKLHHPRACHLKELGLLIYLMMRIAKSTLFVVYAES